MLINTGADANDPERLSMTQDDFSMLSPDEMQEFFKDAPEAIENTQKVADACNFQLELGKTKRHKSAHKASRNEPIFLRDMGNTSFKVW